MGKIRIIGGKYRRRLLSVVDSDGLRPTLDRVKETVFNWLGQDLTGLDCLDLFAGSGSLGFEALSRNAKSVVMVEKNSQLASLLIDNAEVLQAGNAVIYQQDGLKYLHSAQRKFDVIFLDPPYTGTLLAEALDIVNNCLSDDGLIYIECTLLPDLAGFEIFRQSQAGKVKYALLKRQI